MQSVNKHSNRYEAAVPILSFPLLLMLHKYSWNFLIIQLEGAAGLPGLAIVCEGKRAPTAQQKDTSLGLSETYWRNKPFWTFNGLFGCFFFFLSLFLY